MKGEWYEKGLGYEGVVNRAQKAVYHGSLKSNPATGAHAANSSRIRYRWMEDQLAAIKIHIPEILSEKGIPYVSYSLNSLKGGHVEEYIGDYYRGY